MSGKIQKEISDYFQQEASVSLITFLEIQDEIYYKLLDANWKKIYIPDKVNKKIINQNNTFDSSLIEFCEFFKGQSFCQFLEKVTGFELRLDNICLSQYENKSYVLKEYNRDKTKSSYIEVIFDITPNWHDNYGGEQIYLSEEEEFFYIEPSFNTLTILFYPVDINKYLKYVNNLAEDNKIIRIECRFEIIEDNMME
jgi:Rps23 Pro-64 3,4-dihydroxylase Tpa1-like proline 4-hydroxylase